MLTSENLAYKFTDGLEIKFPDLNAQIGEKILITGSSGSGKSTFLNLIAGAIKLQTGKLVFDGFNYEAQKSYDIDKFRAEKIGYVFQTLNLIPFLSVFENISLSIKFSKKRAAKINNVKDFEIYVDKCILDSRKGILETSALVQIKDIKNPSKDRVFLFNNWMFATNAAINAIEHPNYDITLKNCG